MTSYNETGGDSTPTAIGTNEIRNATQILTKYKSGKANLEKRIIENEKWWKMQHWSLLQSPVSTDPRPASGWLFNCIANKHADAMDNYPSPAVLPREENDRKDADLLSSILPVILEYNDFEQTYSDAWWYKLKTGTGCYGVFWNSSLENGLGDIDIKQLDVLNIFWESGIKDIQDSRNLFTVELEDNDILEEKYPHLKGTLGENTIDIAHYIYDDEVDTDNKSAVVDWYYKRGVNGREVVHYCKFVNDTVLYASENDPALIERGYYDHGKYPIVTDVLFSDEGTPCGFGYVDVMKDVQMYIDKLNQIIIKNALQAGRRRFFISDSCGINEEEFADWSKEFVHTSGSLDERNIREINVSQLDSSVLNLLTQKIDELKETSGTRDVSQGGTASGVTAASAIAALQEAGSKLSRDMVKSSYRAFRKINYLIIELIRQFYDEPRMFRISGDDGTISFAGYTNETLRGEVIYDEHNMTVIGTRKPIFDIVVSSQKENPFSTTAQNELAMELFNMGIFDPAMHDQALMCLEMMSFEGKEKIIQQIRARGEELAAAYVLPSPPAIEESDDETYLTRGYKKALPGRSTINSARRRLGI